MTTDSVAPTTTASIYAEPREVTRLEDCWFYTTMDIPGYGTIPGAWDLRNGINEYLGDVSYDGKRVLEVGTASGFCCFELERRGAEVIAFDLSPEYASARNVVPFAQDDVEATVAGSAGFIQLLNNSFWLAHRAYGSKARMVYGSAYAIPPAIGQVDVVLFGAILQHLRDPFQALTGASKLARETMVVVEHMMPVVFDPPPTLPEAPSAPPSLGRRRYLDWALRKVTGDPLAEREARLAEREAALRVYEEQLRAHLGYVRSLPIKRFVPDYRQQMPRDTWWFSTPQLVCEYLGVLGFPRQQLSFHNHICNGLPNTFFTVVAHRA